MTRFSAFLAALVLAGASVQSAQAVESRPPYSTIELQLRPDLPTVGDFSLSDKDSNIYAVGRVLVDFASIYQVLVDHPEARGDCEFIHADYKDGRLRKAAVHQMRYFISFGKSTINLNTESADTELTMEFDFDPTKEFAEGIIRRAGAADRPPAGTCRIRIKDAPSK